MLFSLFKNSETNKDDISRSFIVENRQKIKNLIDSLPKEKKDALKTKIDNIVTTNRAFLFEIGGCLGYQVIDNGQCYRGWLYGILIGASFKMNFLTLGISVARLIDEKNDNRRFLTIIDLSNQSSFATAFIIDIAKNVSIAYLKFGFGIMISTIHKIININDSTEHSCDCVDMYYPFMFNITVGKELRNFKVEASCISFVTFPEMLSSSFVSLIVKFVK